MEKIVKILTKYQKFDENVRKRRMKKKIWMFEKREKRKKNEKLQLFWWKFAMGKNLIKVAKKKNFK